MDEKIGFYLKYKSQIMLLIGAIVGSLGGNIDRYAQFIPETVSVEEFQELSDRVDACCSESVVDDQIILVGENNGS